MPNDDDFDEGVPVLFTPEDAEWDPYDQSFTKKERSLKNLKGEIDPHITSTFK